MIPYPISQNQVDETAFSPTDIASLVLWFDPNEVTDTGSNGTADTLLNQATIPVSPTDGNSAGGAVPLIVTDGYAAGEDALNMEPINTNYYAAATYAELQFDTDEPWSLCWWERSAGGNYYVFDTTSTGRGAQPGMATYWTAGRLVVELVDGVGGEYSHRTGTEQDIGVWHNYIVTYDGSKDAANGFEIYIDGVSPGTVGLNQIVFGTTTHNLGALHLGRKKDGTNYMDSRLGHFMIFNDVLTAQNISDLSTYY